MSEQYNVRVRVCRHLLHPRYRFRQFAFRVDDHPLAAQICTNMLNSLNRYRQRFLTTILSQAFSQKVDEKAYARRQVMPVGIDDPGGGVLDLEIL